MFTLAAALLLACGLGVFYSIVAHHAFAEDNAVLADKGFALSTDLRENGPKAFAEEITAHGARQHTPYWIRILDSDGRASAETPEMDRLIPTHIFPAPRESAEAIRTRKEYRAAGIRRPVDILRVMAFLDLLNLVPAADRIRKAIALINAVADEAGDEDITPTEIAEAIRDCLELSEVDSVPNVRRYLGEALDAVSDGMPADFVAMTLYAALGALREGRAS